MGTLLFSVVSERLANAWKEALAGSNVRAIKISIADLSLVDDGTFNIEGDFEAGQ